LRADKLIVASTPGPDALGLPAWLPLRDAEALLARLADEAVAAAGVAPGASPAADLAPAAPAPGSGGDGSSDEAAAAAAAAADLDWDRWAELGLPLPLLAACAACRAGATRAHLVDAAVGGALVLELYSRDGVGCMVSTDFYEGIRAAAPADLAGVEELLAPLVARGVLVARPREALREELRHFVVVERERKLLACASLRPLGAGAGGETAELGAFCVHPEYRGAGKGDALLEYLEAEARRRGVEALVLLTTRTADWFEQRGFAPAGPAHLSPMLPEARRARVDSARNSQLYTKDLRA
jgi:amino-acid N-acetyltransferase